MGKVVILLSDKRSGSTMFQKELCKHPDIRHVDYTPHTYFETHHWLKGAVLLGMSANLFSGGQVYPGYGSRSNAKAYLLDCVKKNVPGFEAPSDEKKLIFDGWEALCDVFARPVFFEKSPQYLANWASLSLLLDWMKDTHHEVKFIGLTRNPLAVMHSAERLFYTDPQSRQYGWLELQKNLLAFSKLLPEGTYLNLKYEDIIVNPHDAFRSVLEFIDVSACADIGKDVHSDSLLSWKEDKYFGMQLDDTVKQMASYFDYADDELNNPEKPTPPKIERLVRKLRGTLGLWLAKLKNRFIKPLILRLKL